MTRLPEPTALPDRPAARRDDAFVRAVPHAGLDVTFLLAPGRPPRLMDAFQLLLRGLCDGGRSVTRAGILDDHIGLTVDGVALALGAMPRPWRRDRPVCRPADTADARHDARLGWLLGRADGAVRLRLGHGAPAALRDTLVALTLAPARPAAVLIHPQDVMLTMAEFGATEPATLAALARGAPLSQPRARFTRPPRDGQPSPFAARPRVVDAVHLFRPGPPPSAIDDLLDQHTRAGQDARIDRALRAPAPTADPAALPCDAALLRARHADGVVRLPLLWATLVLLAPVAQGGTVPGLAG